MNKTPKHAKTTEVIGLFGIGLLLLAIAAWFDPIGSNPDTGIIDLSPDGARLLLAAFGVFFLIGGILRLVWHKREKDS